MHDAVMTVPRTYIEDIRKYVEAILDIVDEIANDTVRPDAAGNVILHVKLPRAVYDEIVAFCTEKGVDINTFIREAIEEKIAREGQVQTER